MSNRSRRSWYRLSSIVRPTPYSSRDPSSPNYAIEPPLSPTTSPSPPLPPRSPLKEVREAKPSPGLSSRSIKYELPKPSHERETSRQKTLTFSDEKNLVHGPNKEQQQQQHDDELSPASRPSPPPPPQPMSPPLRPPSPEGVQEAKQSPVMTSRSIRDESPKPRQEHETAYQKNILTLSEKTNLIDGPSKTLSSESNDDVTMGTQSVITISGENKGAVMEILQSPSKTRVPYLFINDAEKSTDEKSKSKNHNNIGENHFVNSNIQMINSSVVYNSSETHQDPGVHLSLYRGPSSGNGLIIKGHGNGYTSSIN